MNKFCFIFIFFCCINFYAQNFNSVDKKVLNYPNYTDLYILTDRISKDFTSDLDKVRAIYTWIVNNISYSYKAAEIPKSFSYQTEVELKNILKFRRMQTARSTIIKKAAICHGYATLFNEMCAILNIESKYVSGIAKNEPSDIGKSNTNHSWNVVKINDKKYLIDTTWGAGFYDINDGFKKEITYLYFCTDPFVFIKNHYPEDFEDSLLSEKISKTHFINTPIYYIRNNKNFKLISPKTGKINTFNNMGFTYKIKEKIKWISYLIDGKFYKVEKYKVENQLLSFKIKPIKSKSNEVIIYINGKAINGFKFKN